MASRGRSAARNATGRIALAAAILFASTAALASPAGQVNRFDRDDAHAEPGAAPGDGGDLALQAVPDPDIGASGPALIQGIHAQQGLDDDGRRGAGGRPRLAVQWKTSAPIVGTSAGAVMSLDLGSQTALALRPRGGRWGLLLTRRW